MKSALFTALAASAVLALGNTAANAQVTFTWATVGDAGNAADPGTGSLYGSVADTYKIATTEVNLNQYTAFLNAVAKTDTYSLYNASMMSASIAGISRSGTSGSYEYAVVGTGLRPVTYVSWFDAARFANWLQNGQGSGSTETGVYNMSLGMPSRSGSATYFIPSENEWYKAAYYQPAAQGGDADSYWLYPTASNMLGGNTLGVADSANYNDGNFAKDQNSLSTILTDGGAYGANSASFYGTFDQGGNVFEWNDAVISGSSRGLRGGSWFDSGGIDSSLRSSHRYGYDPSNEDDFVGFRVASVPEPSTMGLLALAGAGWMAWKRRKAAR